MAYFKNAGSPLNTLCFEIGHADCLCQALVGALSQAFYKIIIGESLCEETRPMYLVQTNLGYSKPL